MNKRILIIFNPSAGRGSSDFVKSVIKVLNERQSEVTLKISSSFEEGIEISESVKSTGEYDLVVAAGGDSTIRSIATGLRGSTLPMGIIPMGTGNVFAHELGLYRDAKSIAHYLLNGQTDIIYCGLANDTVFCLMAGVGFDAAVVGKLSNFTKKLVGKAAYIAPIMQTLLGYKKQNITAEIDGINHDAAWIVVTNARYYGGSFDLAPVTSIQKNELHTVLFKGTSRWTMLRQLVALGRGRVATSKGVEHITCREVIIKSEAPSSTQLDGDFFTQTPLHIKLDQMPLKLIIPNRAF